MWQFKKEIGWNAGVDTSAVRAQPLALAVLQISHRVGTCQVGFDGTLVLGVGTSTVCLVDGAQCGPEKIKMVHDGSSEGADRLAQS